MAGNKNLTDAKKAKNDEFYTQRADIEAELSHYEKHFHNKIVYCNCDDPEESEFWKFFVRVFQPWGLKKLIATHYDPNEHNFSYKLEAMSDKNKKFTMYEEPIKTPLPCNGDFRSKACIELLKEADIVVTNPPFSLFREYVAQLMEYEKKFIIIGNLNCVTYKEIFPLIKSNKIWVGVNSPGSSRRGNSLLFGVPNGYTAKSLIMYDGKMCAQVSSWWFTNLDIKKRHVPIDLRDNYYKGHEDKYPKYDNYDAINVDKVADIPIDYDGVMGVPISFLDKYCPEQFEIVTFRKSKDGKDLVFTRDSEIKFNLTFVSLFNVDCGDDKEQQRKDKWENYIHQNHDKENLLEPIDIIFPIATNLQCGLVNNCYVNVKKTYVRVLIKRK